MKTCTVENCDNRHYCKGYCIKHYRRVTRHGNTTRLLHEGGCYEAGGYLRISLKGHPLADKYNRVFMHQVVLYESIGEGPHNCAHCGKEINWRNGTQGNALHVDHLDFNPRNNELSNLVPSCPPCNTNRRKPADAST